MVGCCIQRSAESWCEQGYGVQHWTSPGLGFACLTLSVLCEPMVISNTSLLGSALNSGLCWLSSRLRAKWKEGRQWLGLLGAVTIRLWVTHTPRTNPNKLSYLTKIPSLFRMNRHPLCSLHLHRTAMQEKVQTVYIKPNVSFIFTTIRTWENELCKAYISTLHEQRLSHYLLVDPVS